MVKTPWGDFTVRSMPPEVRRWYDRERQHALLSSEEGKTKQRANQRRYVERHPDRERESAKARARRQRERKRRDSRRGALPLPPLPLPPPHAWTQAERDAINQANREIRNAARAAERAAKKALRSPARRRQPRSRRDVAPGFSWRAMRRFLP